MPPDEEQKRTIDAVDRLLMSAIKDMSMTLGRTALEISQDTTNQLARYRDDAHRSIMGIQSRLVGLEARMDDDDRVRRTRQQQLDAILGSIRRHQQIRMLIEVALIAAAIAYYFGSR